VLSAPANMTHVSATALDHDGKPLATSPTIQL
jgi:hypothetical protein